MADLLAAIDWDEEADELATVMLPHLAEFMGLAAEDAAALLNVGIDFDMDAPQVQRVLKRLATTVKGITDTTRDEIRDIIGQAAEEGEGPAEIARRIRKLAEFGGDDSHAKKRAMNVARSESARAYSAGSVLSYEASGVVSELEWIAPSGACPICADLDGQRVPLGEEFDEGLPPAHTNCRCAISPVVG